MNVNQLVRDEINDSIKTKQQLLEDEKVQGQIVSLSSVVFQALQKGGKVIFAGNGGSFADSQHLAAELVSRYMTERQPLASIALGCNNSAISAIGNDYGYDQVFARELQGIGAENDVVIAISTSGNSPNILKLISVAQEMGLRVFGLTGQTGGKMSELCECIRVPSGSTGRIQESHIMIGHIVCALVDAMLLRGVRA